MKHDHPIMSLVSLLLLALLPASLSFAQSEGGAAGRITDAANGDPLIGVYVTVEGFDNTGTISDLEGRYYIADQSIPDDAVVLFSYIGYDDLSTTLGEIRRNGNVSLSQKNELLDEVVVVGYGVQKKVSSVGSITQTDGEEIMKGGNMNTVSEALQGKLNGVITINSSGQPGNNAASIYIRGKSSWQNTDPLVLVDGIERNMNDVDFNEIESISVLKDASATAVYGVRGANGVILLTTKQGTLDKPTVSFSTNFGFKQPTARLEWADYMTSMKMYNEAAANEGSWGDIIPQSTIDAWQNAFDTGNYGPYNDIFPQVDWYDEMTKTAVSQNYNVNINGKSEFMRYFASVGYQRDGGIYNIKKQPDFDPRQYYSRLNWRANFDFNITKSTVFSVRIAGKMAYRNQQYYNNIYQKILQAPLNDFPIKYSDGYWGDKTNQGYNPIANQTSGGQVRNKIFQGWYDAQITQKLDFITEGLQAHAKIAYNSYSENRDRVRNGGIWGGTDLQQQNLFPREFRTYDYSSPIYGEDGSVTYPIIENASGFHGNQYYQLPVGVDFDALQSAGRRLYYEFAIQYNRTFKGHEVGALALMNRQIIDSKASNMTLDFPQYTEDWVGRVTYNWKERYLFEFNISYTGSEKFAPGKRFGLFPSFSVGYRLTEEPFMQGIKDVLSNVKFRYSWGKVGSDRGATRFQYIQLFNQEGGINFGMDSNTSFGPTYSEGNIAQPNATWETAVKQNLGIEIGLWKKLRIQADLFNERREGILLSPRTTAAWVGVSITAANLGKTKNHGIDLEVAWEDRIGPHFNYFANFNFSTSENRVTFRDDPKNFLEHEKDQGKPIGFQKRYIVSGNYQTVDDIFNGAQSSLDAAANIIPGDFAYIDFNADGVINDKDNVVVEQLNYPLTTYSLTLGFDWKGLGFSAMLYAPTGLYKNGFDVFLWDFPNGNIQGQPDVEKRWTYATAGSTGVQRPALHIAQKHNNQGNTYKYMDYSYLRLKNVEISYRLPRKWIQKVKMSSCTVFANGNNLLTWWGGDNRVDPETGGENVYPIVRSYTVGLRFSF